MPEYINTFLQDLQSGTTVAKIIASAMVIPLALILRWTLHRSISNVEIRSPELKLRWAIQIRNLTFIIVFIALMMIWASELRTTAISLVAFIVAIVLATKELILCVTGSFLKITTHSFSIGNRIEINGIRGDVIDQTLLGTKLMELGPGPNLHQYSGRTITIPNSLFLAQPIINHNIAEDYAIVTLKVPVKIGDNWQQAEQWLLQAATDITEPYLDDARKKWALEQVKMVDLPKIEPRVSLEMTSADQIDLIVRMPVPNQQRNGNSQQVLRRYLQLKAEALEAEELKKAKQTDPSI